MTGERIKTLIADACRTDAARAAGIVVVYLRARVQDATANGMPDLCILAPWGGRWCKVELECKSARERLRPAQVAYAAAAYLVQGDGYVYRVVRQTPEAPGELAARAAATCLGLVELANSLPVAGPGAVYDAPNRFAVAAPARERASIDPELLAEARRWGPAAEAALRADHERRAR